MQKKRIGIFGGSFDPIHTGHLLICNIIKEELKLDKVVFVPAYRSPHKEVSKFTSPQIRYEMVKLAIEDNEGFDISDYEIKQSRSVYSIETIDHMQQAYPKSELFLILGLD
ncbi:MAG: nicotinate-nicotinamide nucleotide adenylyltransferase, partial [Candidatus Delongbacteria bacterium]|nr:nicotinate-nicotinamide nucleotide adenylyltransferase [Candidatus Delongbacteria bacterium]